MSAVNNECIVNVTLWTKEAHTRRKPNLCLHFLSKKTPLHALLESSTLPLLFSCPSMKHDVDDPLIYLTADILIQNYPNTVNARWHEAKSVDVIDHRTTDQTQKSTKFEHRNIVRLQSVCGLLFSTSRQWK